MTAEGTTKPIGWDPRFVAFEEAGVSVIMMLKVKADPAALKTYASSNGDKLKRIAQEGKAKARRE